MAAPPPFGASARACAERPIAWEVYVMAEGWGAFYVPRLAKLCTACSGVLRFRLTAMSARASAHLRVVPQLGGCPSRSLE